MPSQRFRFEHYLKILQANNISYKILSFYDDYTWSILYKKGRVFPKIWGLFKNILKRFFQIFSLYKYDFVFIHREMAPIGPPVFEWCIKKIFRKKIIYDFDDAIWVDQSSEANPKAALIKCAWKVKYICKYSKTVSVGNRYLAAYASSFCNDVRIIPTVVDTDLEHNTTKNQLETPLCIGWTGTFTNFYNLDLVNNAIAELQKDLNFEYLIISNEDPCFKNIKYTYKPWQKESEIADLLKINIGIMPLYDREVERGKCAFKAIQYMALGIPAVVSPVGANCEVVQNNENGFWADSVSEWEEKLRLLLLNTGLRQEMGKKAQNFIIQNYSVLATTNIFLSLFQHENKLKTP